MQSIGNFIFQADDENFEENYQKTIELFQSGWDCLFTINESGDIWPNPLATVLKLRKKKYKRRKLNTAKTVKTEPTEDEVFFLHIFKILDQISSF